MTGMAALANVAVKLGIVTMNGTARGSAFTVALKILWKDILARNAKDVGLTRQPSPTNPGKGVQPIVLSAMTGELLKLCVLL